MLNDQGPQLQTAKTVFRVQPVLWENPGPDDIVLETTHSDRVMQPLSWARVIVRAGRMAMTAHGHYSPKNPSGRPFDLTRHLGAKLSEIARLKPEWIDFRYDKVSALEIVQRPVHRP